MIIGGLVENFDSNTVIPILEGRYGGNASYKSVQLEVFRTIGQELIIVPSLQYYIYHLYPCCISTLILWYIS